MEQEQSRGFEEFAKTYDDGTATSTNKSTLKVSLPLSFYLLPCFSAIHLEVKPATFANIDSYLFYAVPDWDEIVLYGDLA